MLLYSNKRFTTCLGGLALGAALLALPQTSFARAHAAHKPSPQAERLEAEGNRYLVDDQFAKALPLIQQAIKIDPTRPGYWQDLGVCFSQMNRNDEAIAAYRNAGRLKPNDPLILSNLAIVLNKSGRHAEAVGVARKAIKAAGPSDQDTADRMNKILHG